MKKNAKKQSEDFQQRRNFLKKSGLVAVSLGNPLVPMAFQMLANSKSARAESSDNPAFVYIFLRGGADGLSIVPPWMNHPDRKAYEQARPNIRLDSTLTTTDMIQLGNTQFGLNKACPNLLKLYTENRASFYHGVGNRASNSRSHFIQQDYIDRGGVDRQEGYLNRLLSMTAPQNAAIVGSSASPNLSKALSGAKALDNNIIIPVADMKTGAVTLEEHNLSIFHRLFLGSGLASRLEATWDQSDGTLGSKSVVASKLLNKAMHEAAKPSNSFGSYGKLTQFETAAKLLVGCPSLQFLTIDVEGWDTHDVMGPKNGGYFYRLLAQFDQALGQLIADLERNNRKNVRIVIVSEFGRPLRENGTLGLDHGRGGLAITIGPKNEGGKIITDKAFTLQSLEDDRDIQVTIDHRQILGNVLLKSGLVSPQNIARIFPQSQAEISSIGLIGSNLV